MTTSGEGPPGEGGGPGRLADSPRPAAANFTQSTTRADASDSTARNPQHVGRGEELLAQLRRRQDAAARLPKLPNGYRDPIPPRSRADCQERSA